MQLDGAVRQKGAPLGERAMPQGIDGGGQTLDKGEHHEKSYSDRRPSHRPPARWPLCRLSEGAGAAAEYPLGELAMPQGID